MSVLDSHPIDPSSATELGGDAAKLHADSYYAFSANQRSLRHRLNGQQKVDVCIVGAGYTGLSTALSLAEKGYSVAVLEAKAIGFGASGRNGGQIVNGLNASIEKVRRQFGQKAADFVGAQVKDGSDLIKSRIAKYNIDCDFQPGNIFTAFTAKHMRELEAKQALWRTYGMDDHELLDEEQIQRHIGSNAYCGGMIDHSGGHLHPLNLALGEADAIEMLGGRIFEQSEVTRIESTGGKHIAHTTDGSVVADTLVLCGNAYLNGVAPNLEKRVMQVSTQVLATAPLSANEAADLLPTNMCVEDVRYVLDYYRMSADNRLLFGGGLVYGGTSPANIRAKLYPNMLRIFPQLADKQIDFAWSGNFALSYSRVPQLGRLPDGTYFSHGYSGHGVTGSHIFGAILADAIHGDQSKFDTFSNFPHMSFPGGRTLRVPYSVVGSWWYALRDKLGV